MPAVVTQIRRISSGTLKQADVILETLKRNSQKPPKQEPEK